MKTIKVRFLPDDTEVTVKMGVSIMEATVEARVEVEGHCGGKGTCGKCRVKLHLEEEGKWVHACHTPVTHNITIEIPQTEVLLYRKSDLTNAELDIAINPGVHKVFCRLEPPSLRDQAPDVSRILNILRNDDLNFKVDTLRTLPKILREDDFKVTVVIAGERVLPIEPGNTTSTLYGLAVDIGTTTVVASLVNLWETSATNTQYIWC